VRDWLHEIWSARPGSNPSEALLPLPQLGNVTGAVKVFWFSSYEWKYGSLRAVKANAVRAPVAPQKSPDGIHFVQETCPHRVGAELSKWYAAL
jgi:hypothetical protein